VKPGSERERGGRGVREGPNGPFTNMGKPEESGKVSDGASSAGSNAKREKTSEEGRKALIKSRKQKGKERAPKEIPLKRRREETKTIEDTS